MLVFVVNWLKVADTELVDGKEEIAWLNLAAAALIVAVKVSETLRPLTSVAVTFSARVEAVVGAVPENVSVVALNFSHVGRAVDPLAVVGTTDAE